MKKDKIIINVIFNFFVGFISRFYITWFYLTMTNTSKGTSSEYYNPEGESLQVLGFLALLLYFFVLLTANVYFAYKMKMIFRKAILMNINILLAGVALSVILGFPE